MEVLAATKYVALQDMPLLAQGGVTLVGENRAQDLQAKVEAHGGLFEWDFIGQLQSRRVRQIVPLVRMIHSVASDSAMRELERHRDLARPGLKLMVEVRAGDHAEGLRNRCLTRLALNPTPEARAILLEMREDPSLATVQTIVDPLVKRQREAAVEASVTRWTEEDVLRLERNDEKLPRSLDELFELVKAHLLHVHDLVANDDFSYRELFKPRGKDKETTKEREIQLWVASCLRQRARGLYSVVRENVVDEDKEVDISAFVAGVGHVPVEIKPLGDYSAAALEESLERQLLGQYMQPPDRRCGILLLVRRDERKWRLDDKDVELAALVSHLRLNAHALGARNGKDIFVAVIDLLATPVRQSSGTAVAPKRLAKKKRRTEQKVKKAAKTTPKEAHSRPPAKQTLR